MLHPRQEEEKNEAHAGAEKHTTTAEELVAHLKKHLPEEEQEIAGGDEPEYE